MHESSGISNLSFIASNNLSNEYNLNSSNANNRSLNQYNI